MMKVGVVCEGPTDFYAIREFFGCALESRGIECEFVALQPRVDNTRPQGGWANVLGWLMKNPPRLREVNLFGAGLFATSSASFDALLIQVDTDILGEPQFEQFIKDNFGYDVGVPDTPDQRADEIRKVLRLAAQWDDMTAKDQDKHVLAAAVESTENWCVAAFMTPTRDFEALSGQELVDQFMSALQRFEGTEPTPPYGTINKSQKRRFRFCQAHSGSHERVASGCTQFRLARDELIALS